ncbi:MAG: HAD-IA family hydrolase [Paludibacteraceae bacterium]|nr:HAD-IA family hydrolase [Paludibacteraceae bacterium]
MQIDRPTIDAWLHRNNYSEYAFRGVLFDMDGVLFDSMPFHARSWHEAFAGFGIAFSEYQVYLQEGSTGSQTVNDVFMAQKGRYATDEEINALYERKCDLFQQYAQTVPMAGAHEVLEAVRQAGLKIGLVTGSGQKSLIGKLNQYYPGIFDPNNMVTAFDVQHSKPHPEPYLKGMVKLGIRPEETIVVENAPMGVRAAVAAGALTIGVNTGILKREDLALAGADIVLDNMRQVEALLGN